MDSGPIFPTSVCPDREAGKAHGPHRIDGTWREGCPGVEQEYQYAIRLTFELLDGNGNVEDAEVKTRVTSEENARCEYSAMTHMLADPNRRHPKYQRISAVALLRRPIGPWEEVTEK